MMKKFDDAMLCIDLQSIETVQWLMMIFKRDINLRMK